MRPWDSLSEDEKRLFARMAEVYAGFVTHCDHEIGRFIDYLEESGQLENTIVVVVSDNGASGEGGPNGSFNVFVRPIKNGQWAGEEMMVTTDNRFPRNRLYFGFWDLHVQPAWTRDGRHLLVVSNRGVALGSGHVWKIPVEPDAMKKAVPVLQEQSLFRVSPHVSIDGKRFIYSSHRGTADQYDNLYVLPVDGGAPYKLTLFSHDAFHPRWSPDGESVAYISNEGGVPRLALLDTYGGNPRNIDIVQRRWQRPVGVLSIRTFDQETRQLTPSRIQLTAGDGKFYAPPDTYARVAQGSRAHAFHIPGSTSFEVPVGKLRLDVVKGFEFYPEQVEMAIGQALERGLTTQRRLTEAASERSVRVRKFIERRLKGAQA